MPPAAITPAMYSSRSTIEASPSAEARTSLSSWFIDHFTGTLLLLSKVHTLLGQRLALLHVEAAGIDRPLAGRRTRILHDQDFAASGSVELAFEMRVGVVEHRARRAEPAVDGELALQDEPELGEAVIVLGMMRARFEPQDAGVGRGRLLGRGMEQHLAG